MLAANDPDKYRDIVPDWLYRSMKQYRDAEDAYEKGLPTAMLHGRKVKTDGALEGATYELISDINVAETGLSISPDVAWSLRENILGIMRK